MAPIKVAVWSAVVEPGKELAIVVPKDFTLTNAALAEDLADPKGRSVLKLTHVVIPDKFLRTPDDYSDLEDEEDEEEDEEDPEAAFEDATTVLTSLTAGRTEQCQLNLTFNERDELIFTVTGSNVVHLSGNYIEQAPEDDDSGDDQDPDSDEFDSDMDPEDFDDEEDEDEDEEMSEEAAAGKITEIPEPAKGKRTAAAAELEQQPTEGLSKNQQKKLAKKLKAESGEAAPAPVAAEKPKAAEKAAEKPAAKKEEKSTKKVHGNGLITEDSKLGTGAVAKAGKKVGMRYIGKLANGKVFDSNTNGKPFTFVLGKGEVIKGWDIGVAGMAIGGERKLTIPAALAYGSKALPGIPKNSTLHFEVKLVSVQ